MQLSFFKSFSNLYTIFYLLFGCHPAKYRPLLRDSLTNQMLITDIQVLNERSVRALLQDWVPKPILVPSGV